MKHTHILRQKKKFFSGFPTHPAQTGPTLIFSPDRPTLLENCWLKPDTIVLALDKTENILYKRHLVLNMTQSPHAYGMAVLNAL